MNENIKTRLMFQLNREQPGKFAASKLWHLRGADGDAYTWDVWTLLGRLFLETHEEYEWSNTIIRNKRSRTLTVTKLEIEQWAELTDRQGNKLDALCRLKSQSEIAGFLRRNW